MMEIKLIQMVVQIIVVLILIFNVRMLLDKKLFVEFQHQMATKNKLVKIQLFLYQEEF